MKKKGRSLGRWLIGVKCFLCKWEHLVSEPRHPQKTKVRLPGWNLSGERQRQVDAGNSPASQSSTKGGPQMQWQTPSSFRLSETLSQDRERRQAHPTSFSGLCICVQCAHRHTCVHPSPYIHESRKFRFWNCFELLYEVSALGFPNYRNRSVLHWIKRFAVKSSIFKSRDTQKGCRTAASAYSGNHVRIELTRQRRGQRHGQLCSHLLLQWSTSFPAFSMFWGNPISHPPWIIKSWLLKNLV